jgi:uncharacterized protein
MLELLKQPWPWYISGPLIGLTIPLLLILGNKTLGISSSFRHMCAACIPGDIEFLKYDWRKEIWSLVFVAGILFGGFIAYHIIGHPGVISISADTAEHLENLGIEDQSGFLPSEVFSWEGLFTIKGLILIVVGGFLVGFGTRYAGGCTSGHAIMGLSNLQWPSLVAVMGFFAGGLIMTHLILPLIFKL